MIFHDIYLSDLEYDKLRERLDGTEDELSGALKEMNINMEPHRAYECISTLGFWGKCNSCGLWADVDDENICWLCFDEFHDEEDHI